MLIIALVLAVVSLAALVTAVVTSNEPIAWVCIGLSALGVLLLIIDAIRDRHHRLGAAPAVLEWDRTDVIVPVDSTEVIEDAEAVVIDGDGFAADHDSDDEFVADYPDADFPAADVYGADVSGADGYGADDDHPDEVIFDEPDYDTPSDDEPVYPMPAEEAAIHTVTEDPEFAGQPYTADSTTVSYAVEPSADESATLTEEESSAVVIYADDTVDAETGGSAVRYESGSER